MNFVFNGLTLPVRWKVSVFYSDTANYSRRAILQQQRMESQPICHGFPDYQNSLFELKENANALQAAIITDFLIRVVLCSFH